MAADDNKPAFDPSQPFSTADADKPAFDPNQSYSVTGEAPVKSFAQTTLENVGGSAYNLAKGVVQTAVQAGITLANPDPRAKIDFLVDLVEGTYHGLKERYGQGIEHAIESDPAGVLSDMLAVAGIAGGIKALPKTVPEAFKQFHEQVVKNSAGNLVTDQSPDPPRITTPLPENAKPDFPPRGVPRSQLAQTGDPLIDGVINHPVLKNVIDNPIIDRSHEIGNSWGGSVPIDNPITHVDKEFPPALTIDGRVIDPADPATVHENVEELVIDQLMKGGMNRDAALRAAYWGWGNPAEHAWYRAHGIDPDHAEAALKPYLDAIASRKLNPANIPADLFKQTYPDGDPLKAAPGDVDKPSAEEAARARQIIADWQDKGSPISEAPAVDTSAGIHTVNIGEGGGTIGYEVDEHSIRVRHSYLPAGQRRQGVGIEAYQRLADAALAQGKTFTSDSSVSPSASRIYDALERRGYTVERKQVGGGTGEQAPISELATAFAAVAERQGGIHTVYISDLIKESGLPAEYVKNLLTAEAKEGNVHLAKSSKAEITEEQKSAAIELGGRKLHTATLPDKFKEPRYEFRVTSGPTSTVNPLQEAHELGVIGPTRQPHSDDSPAQAAQRAIPANRRTDPNDKITMTPNGEPISDWDSRFKDWVDRLKAPEEIKPLIEDAAERNDKWAATRATGEVNPAHVDTLADAAGVDPTKLDRSFIRSNFDNDAKIRMAKQYLDTTIDDFLKASDKAAADPSPENMSAMIESEIKRDLMLEQLVGGYRSEWGRSGHALRDLLAAKKGAPSTGLTEEIKKKMAGAPKSVTDAIDAARETLDKAAKAKPGDEEFGLDKLIKAAQDLVEETKPKEAKPGEPKPKAPELSADVKELVKRAEAVTNLMKRPAAGARPDTVLPLPKLYREGQQPAPRNALAGFNALVTEAQRNVAEGLKEGKTVREAMPKELRDMIDAAQNVTSHFGGSGLQRAIQDLLAKKGRTPEDMQTIARSMRGLSNEQAARILTDMNGKQQPWYYWAWQQGLISGEVTHTKYVVSNFGFSTMDRVAAPGVAALIGKLHGGERVFFGEPVMGMYGLIRGVPNAMRAALAAFKTGLRVPLAEEMQLADRLTARGERLPRDLLHTQQVPYGNPGAPNWGIWQRVLNQKQLEGAASTVGIPGRFASAIHAGFKNLNVEASKRARAYHAAAQEESNPLSKEFEDRYNYHYEHPTDEALRGSVQDGYSGTFMDKLGPLEARLASAIRDTKFKWAFPFMHIPINIVRNTVRYSPAAWVSKATRDDLRGLNGQVAQDLAISKMVIGSSIVGYFVYKGMNGEATGDYPIDPKDRQEWKISGKIPNAMQIGGQWVQMQRFGPPGNLASLGAAWGATIAKYEGAADESTMEKAGNIIGHMMMSAVQMIGNETGFLSLQNLFDLLEGKQSPAEFAAYEASTFLPFSSFVRQTASALDPDMRQARTLLDGFKAAIPGLRNTLLPKRDPLYGEPVPNPGYHTVFRQVPVQTDFAKQELTRIGYFPTAPEAKIGQVKLTPEQFDKYEATAGPLVKAALNGLVRSPQWRAHNNNPEWQTTIAKQIVSAARAKARRAMQLDNGMSLVQTGRQRRLTQINGPK